MPQKQSIAYNLGLDIGIASVGWCVLGEQHIVDLGVRAFDKAENEEGKTHNSERRTARLSRRRLRRRAWRLLKLARLFKREGLISNSEFFQQQKTITQSLWQLRVEGLDRKLNNEEWARVIYHICKHRGFWFQRKADAQGSEGGKVYNGMENTRSRMQKEGYRTTAEMMIKEFPEKQRNKKDDYSQSLGRELIANELNLLFKNQRQLGNPHACTDFEALILQPETGLFWQQKPALSGEAMLKLVGKCTFEKTEYRAAKHTWSAERFVWLTKLNNLRINIDGQIRGLNEAERKEVIELPYKKEKTGLKYNQLKKHLIKAGYWNTNTRFVGLHYYESVKDPEETVLIKMTGWNELRKALEKAGLNTEWQSIATQPTQLDLISSILSIYKTDQEIRDQLGKLQLNPIVIDALLTVSFKDFIRLSLKALEKILPSMEQGKRYDEACLIAGYHHSKVLTTKTNCYLPPLDNDAPQNPVVHRALNQARKVVNALVRQYGSPKSVHIEMARDLSRSLDERKKIEKAQKEFADINEKDRECFTENFGRRPTGREFEKWQFYREQDGKCAYSIKPLDLNRVINDIGYVEIDHALPYSRSFDNSRNNKVLVLARENHNKGNQTPYEYLHGANDSQRWQEYQASVTSNKKYRQAKRDRLLRRVFDRKEMEEFKERNLNDTRYACRYFKNFVEQNLKLEGAAQRCVVLSGQLTSFLRTRWGLTKLRDGSGDRHHAVDAAIIAACSHSMVKRLSDYARHQEIKYLQTGSVDIDTGEIINSQTLQQLESHFPKPWENFAVELCLRAGIDRNTGKVSSKLDATEWVERLAALGYSETTIKTVRPLFVSRAPKRRNKSAAHKDTIYAARPTQELPNRVTQKIALTVLKLSDLSADPENCTLTEPHRNESLYVALRERLQAFGGKAEKAFAEPFYKPTRDGSRGPIVRTVTKVIENQSGISLRGGIAKNDSMIRVDVFQKAGKYYLVPIYEHHRVAKLLPNRAIVAHKDEKDWTLIDDTFQFCFSIYPNDLIQVTLKGKPLIEGYYAGCDRAAGAINLWAQDRNPGVGKEGQIRGIGVKTALKMERFNVDVLGKIYNTKPEVRSGLA